MSTKSGGLDLRKSAGDFLCVCLQEVFYKQGGENDEIVIQNPWSLVVAEEEEEKEEEEWKSYLPRLLVEFGSTLSAIQY
jgi:hypothetical protein